MCLNPQDSFYYLGVDQDLQVTINIYMSSPFVDKMKTITDGWYGNIAPLGIRTQNV